MRFLPVLAALLFPIPLLAQQFIAPTEANSPADELKTFKVPAGFEVQLVAAEPDIGKPIQMAFDAKGRLWVTTSRHYPFAAEGKASDKVFILSDFDAATGKAKTVTTFADDMNIPIGILPLPDGQSCLVSNVGSILKLTDTDGDGKADTRETILTGFGTRDTHGMMNSFLLMPDGWVYACHGYLNSSVVKAKDGSEVQMQSGNTFRFRPNGARVEPWTYGQVNPFGLTVDPWGNLYTADCHSKPITQLIRGAHYDSFGKPHDGLGYAPHVTRHDHGSTALCGLAWYNADQFPAKYKGMMFLGNVVTNRINSDKIVWKGSTPVAEEQPDFVSSTDPWFRPTDIKIGPDGALYFADFYNKIIGHYEVDLKHPQRDKDRGRVWRVVYKGDKGTPKPDGNGPVSRESLQAIRAMIELPQLTAEQRASLLAKLKESPFVQRAVVDVLISHPHADNVLSLIELLKQTPAEDTHLRHAARIALRNSLRDAKAWDKALPADAAIVADVALGVHTAEAATFLTKHLQTGSLNKAYFTHVGRYGDNTQATALIDLLESQSKNPAAVVALEGLYFGHQARGAKLPDSAGAVAEKLCADGLKQSEPNVVLASANMAGALKLTNLFDPLTAFAARTDRDTAQRSAALTALTLIDQPKAITKLGAMIMDANADVALREQAATALGKVNQPAAHETLLRAFAVVPTRIANTISTALTTTPNGAKLLVEAVKQGKASPTVLQVKATRTNLANGPYAKVVDELTANLPREETNLAAVIRSRTASYPKAKPDLVAGKVLYTKHCAVCHQLANEGAKVGPQLDGIGNRGLDRLMEDILTPNRNVDAAFRATTINLLDGRTLTGLLIREEGQVSVLVDLTGKEQRLEAKDIDTKQLGTLSPMPANFDTALTEPEFRNLMGYLLEQRVQK